MGHNHSSCSSKHSLGEWREYLFSQGHLLKQVATLKYTDFLQAVESLNTVSNSLSNSRGKYLVFSIVPETDCTTILWKSRVRIQCRKMTCGTNKCESTRTMTLKQFVQVYDSIMQQCVSIEDRLASREATERPRDAERDREDVSSSRLSGGAAEVTQSETEECDGQGEGHQQPSRVQEEWLEISTIFATVEQVSLESIDEGDCCICMEKKADIVLSCAHTYCQLCIEDWRRQHNTCPMCMGEIGTSNDVWALPDKPDAEEMTTYLMSIADSKEERRLADARTRRSEPEEWETLSFNP